MDLNALMQAAAQDPKAAAFLQQMLAGGTPIDQRMPEIAPQSLRAPSIQEMPEAAQMPVFQPAKSAMDELLKNYNPQAQAGQGGDPTLPPGVQPVQPALAGAGGQPAAPAGDPGMIGQMEGQGDVSQQPVPYSPEQVAAGQDPASLMDFITMAQGWLGGGQG
jgi:hypothetical protein